MPGCVIQTSRFFYVLNITSTFDDNLRPWRVGEAVDEPLEGGVGGGEDGERVPAAQRVDEAGGLDEAEQRVQARGLETSLQRTLAVLG